MQRYCGLLAMVTATFLISASNADTYFVDHAVTVSGDGSNWPNAFKTLQEAFDEADGFDGADIINVADGTYKPSTPSGTSATFLMERAVSILGGWAGVSDPSAARNPNNYITIFSGDLSGNDTPADFSTNRTDNAVHVVKFASDNFTGTILDGVTVSGGVGTNGGGAIIILNAVAPLIRDCIFQDNGNGGAAAYLFNSKPTFRECRFIENVNNSGTGDGGGMYIHGGEPIVVQCKFIRNWTIGNGGGIRAAGEASPYIFNCMFHGNYANHAGGGLFSRNEDPNPELDSTTLLVVNCAFVGNRSKDTGGGARVGFNSICRFVQCTFADNDCTEGPGGGLSLGANDEGPARSMTVDNCVFWNNVSELPGTQISLNGAAPGTATITYCDIQDSDTSEPGVYVETGWTAPIPTAWIDADPDFMIDPDPGTLGWGNSDDDYGDLTPSISSPVINKGDCSRIPDDKADVDENSGTTVLPWDLAKLTRRVLRVDMGAYEFQTVPDTCAGDTNSDGTVNVADLLAVINQWGLTGAPSGDVNNFPCGDGVVSVADLLTVIMYWGPCPEDDEGTPAGAPQTVQDCLSACAPLGIGTPEYAECVEKCINALP